MESGSTPYSVFEILDRAGYSLYLMPLHDANQLEKKKKYSNRVSRPTWGGCQYCTFEARLQTEECLPPTKPPVQMRIVETYTAEQPLLYDGKGSSRYQFNPASRRSRPHNKISRPHRGRRPDSNLRAQY